MYARSPALATLAVLALTLPVTSSPRFALSTTGSIALTVAGGEARYGVISGEVDGHSRLIVSLGATSAQGSLTLYLPGAQLPAKGRYPIRSSGEARDAGELPFGAFFVAGTPEHPLGWFHGESGWVSITEASAGRISGEFEIQARGFLGANPENENRWVTVRGTFEAHGDRAIGTVASIQ